MPEILSGTVKKVFVEQGYGFLRPDGGGRDVFFHANDARRIVDLSGKPGFAGPDREVVPKAGDTILYELRTEDGRPKAAPWGLPGSAAPARLDYANAPTDALIAGKSANGNFPGVQLFLLEVRGQMTENDFRVFCAMTPDGEAFWLAWKEFCRSQSPRTDVEAIEFVLAEFERALPTLVGPRRCQQPATAKRFIVERGLPTGGVDERTLTLLYLEDPATMERLAPGICRGCNKPQCPNYAAFANRRRR